MAVTKISKDGRRIAELKEILNRARTDTRARVLAFRGDQDADVAPPPADEMDVARSLAEVETHASLIERAQDQLRAIDAAMTRVEDGSYGICANCGEEIPTERLRIMPFTPYCVDCQSKLNRVSVSGRGAISGSFRKRWMIPAEVDESLEGGDEVKAPEEDISVHDESPFGPEESELEMEPGPSRRRGRPRKKPAAGDR